MFGAVKQMLQLSAASVVAQNLLEQQQRTGLFDIDPKALSNRLVALTFGHEPDLVNGKRGPKPHKMSMAAVALAQGMRELDRNSDDYMACFLAVGVILMEMEENGGKYPLTGKDAQFLELARREYLQHEFDDNLGGQEGSGARDNVDQPLSEGLRVTVGMRSATAQSVDPELHDRKMEIEERLRKLTNSG